MILMSNNRNKWKGIDANNEQVLATAILIIRTWAETESNSIWVNLDISVSQATRREPDVDEKEEQRCR